MGHVPVIMAPKRQAGQEGTSVCADRSVDDPKEPVMVAGALQPPVSAQEAHRCSGFSGESPEKR